MDLNNLDLGLDFDVSSVLKELQEENAAMNAIKGKKHILVVDDERTFLKTIKSLLDIDYDVTTLANGRTVMDFFKTKTADLIILDYEMPVFSGVDVMKELRSNPKTKNIPVIFLTGMNFKEKIEEALSLRPNAYLLKPINAARLREEIERILSE